MFIKFCGFTRAEDVEAACALPISAVGFVFYIHSRRSIEPGKAAQLSRIAHRAGVQCAGVFAGRSEAEIRAICETADLDLIQLYEHELIPALHGFRPIIAAHRVTSSADCAAIEPPLPGDCVLLDRRAEGSLGGTGKGFDWNCLKDFALLDRAIIAGGINEENAASLLDEHRPYGIDLSSGIEDFPGLKSTEKMKAFMKKINMVMKNETHAR